MKQSFYERLLTIRHHSEPFLAALRALDPQSSLLAKAGLRKDLILLVTDLIESIDHSATGGVYYPDIPEKSPLKTVLERFNLSQKRSYDKLEDFWRVVMIKEGVAIIHSELSSLLLASDGFGIKSFSRDYKAIVKQFHKLGKKLDKEVSLNSFIEVHDQQSYAPSFTIA